MTKQIIMTTAVRDALEEELERREAGIQEALAHGQVVDKPFPKGVVGIGSTVTVHDSGEHRRYMLVGTIGAHPKRGWLTTESPLGAALLSRRRGETVDVAAPDGRRPVTVVTVDEC